MASATVDSTTAANTADGGALRLDSIPIVDLRLLSQSELYSLSRCSSSTFDPSRREDVVVPIIDRSVFNESAGSRKQTYCRLRLTSSASSSPATPRRRTAHLRSTAATFGSLSHRSDPENAENAQIVNLLKQFFIADMNPEDLVPVKIEYSDTLPVIQFPSPPPSSPSNVGSIVLGQKRKRGRPRKDEALGNERDLSNGFGVVDVDVGVSDADGFSLLNEISVGENLEERDREVLNSDGVAVDLVALGAVEHPYSEEIHRRTEGLQTEEEFFEFLKRLNGMWGSRRKKKRIVDASEFGAVLPVGWKLSLSIKKKNDRVWLYCRRYISPSGLHFVSCKGVSSYLCSLHGIQDTNPHTSAHYDEMIIDADKLTSVPIVHHSIEEVDKMENLASHASSPALGSTTGNDQREFIVYTVLPEDRVRETLHCEKFGVTFIEKDELLQQQSSLQRKNRYKNDTRITDGVIIKDGKYECQFCHKTFSERHRYNGHVGTHVRYQAKTAGESSKSVIRNFLNSCPIQDISTEGPLKSHNAVEICDSIKNNVLNIGSSCNINSNEHVGDLRKANDMRGIDIAIDMVTEINPCSVAENKSSHEDACLNDPAAEMVGDSNNLLEKRSSLSLPLDEAKYGIKKADAIEDSASVEKSEKIMTSENCLLAANDNVEECFVVNNNEHIYQTRNQCSHDFEKFAIDGSMHDSLRSQLDLESLPCKNTITTDSTSISRSGAPELNKNPSISILDITLDEKACVEDNDPCSVEKDKVNEALSFDKYEKKSSKADNDGVSGLGDDMRFRIASVIPSWNEHENVSQKDDPDTLGHLMKVPGLQDMSKGQLVECNEIIHHYGNNDDRVSREKTELPEFDAFQSFGNVESSDTFDNSRAHINSSSIMGTNQGEKLGVCSAFASASDKQLFTKDNMIRIFNDTLEEHREEPSQSIVLGRSGVAEISGDPHALNKIYANPANPSKFNKLENTGTHDLSLSFGNLRTDMCTDSHRVETGRYRANNFNIDSVVHKTYRDSTHLNILSSIPADQKQDRFFGIEFPNSSFNDRAHNLGSSFNMAHSGRDWNGTRGENLGASGQNFTVGFGNSSQSSECVRADGSWRSVHENVFAGCFDANSDPIPSSSCFHSFGLTSDKGEGGSFGVNKNYDIRTDTLRSGRIQPVEYSFMGQQSPNSLTGESKIFPYNTDMEQGLDPSFWLGKDALTPNASHMSQVTSVCVWCRNVFFQEPAQAGIQAGAIGTMCPSCSSRIPGQFNVL